MSIPLLLAFIGGSLFATLLATGAVRRYALRRRILLDIPNERSSHRIPTPRGGGLGIVIIFSITITVLWLANILPRGEFVAMVGGGLAVAVIGYCDDRFCIPPTRRLLVHFGAAIWALIWLNGMPPLRVMTWTIDWGLLGNMVGVLGLVWLINLYNFMDGIDGLAGSEAVFVAGVGGLLLWLSDAQAVAAAALVLAAACLGFLYWNWPPAKIFMGDVGSGFLGYALGVLAIASAGEKEASLWIWFLLLSVFIVDATVTLIRRFIYGKKCFDAHRSHAYQHATTLFGRHLKVTIAIMSINLLGLLPLALITWKWPNLSLLTVSIAVALLTALALRFSAGVELNKQAEKHLFSAKEHSDTIAASSPR